MSPSLAAYVCNNHTSDLIKSLQLQYLQNLCFVNLTFKNMYNFYKHKLQNFFKKDFFLTT